MGILNIRLRWFLVGTLIGIGIGIGLGQLIFTR
jgi:hypothetical protein